MPYWISAKNSCRNQVNLVYNIPFPRRLPKEWEPLARARLRLVHPSSLPPVRNKSQSSLPAPHQRKLPLKSATSPSTSRKTSPSTFRNWRVRSLGDRLQLLASLDPSGLVVLSHGVDVMIARLEKKQRLERRRG